MPCPICGSEILENDVFCVKCGNKIPRCPSCGRVVSERMRFCIYDGTQLPDEVLAAFPLESGENAPQQETAEGSGGVSYDSPADINEPNYGGGAQQEDAGKPNGAFYNGPVYENGQYYGDPNRGAQPPEKKPVKVWLIIVIIAAALLITAAVAGVLFFLNSDKNSEEKIETTEIATEEETETEETQEATTQETEEETETGQEAETEDALAALPSPEVSSASATSELSEYGMTHTASLATDGDLSTGWAEGADGQGTGEAITLIFEETSRIEGFTIYAGYQKSGTLYEANSRPQQITLSFSDGTEITYLLDDVNGPQSFTFDEPVAAEGVVITIDSVYEGSKYEDTVITEIQFY